MQPPLEHSAAENRWTSRFDWRWLVVFGVYASVALPYWFFFVRPKQEHLRWHERTAVAIQALGDKRPFEVPPAHWKFMVEWTQLLHANCGMFDHINRRQLWTFLEELERRSQGEVSSATIDWIWDEYARFTKNGRRYGERYRPTRSPELEYPLARCCAAPRE